MEFFMYKTLIKYSFLLACANLTFSNAYAMVVDPPEGNKGIPSKTASQQAMEDQWEFKKYDGDRGYGLSFSKAIKISSRNSQADLEAIYMGILQGKKSIYVNIKSNFAPSKQAACKLRNNQIETDLKSHNILHDVG